jgi:PAS domain S-box-containing protein
MRVLIIEDTETDALLATAYLKRWMPEITIIWVDTLAKARLELDAHSFNPYDIVLCDVNLPDGNGINLVSEINQKDSHPPVIILSGHGIEETAVAAVKAGAEDYVVKEGDYVKNLPSIINLAIRRAKSSKNQGYHALKVLYAEHIATDIDLTLRHFQHNAPNVQFDTVRNGDEILEKLSMDQPEKWYDVVLLDYQLPSLSGLDVLKELVQVRHIRIPVVLVTGHGGESVAVQALKLGASEYVVKNPGYLSKLPFVLENAYSRTQLFQEQEALKESEARYRRLAENAPDIIYRYRFLPNPGFEYISPAIEKLLDFKVQNFYDDPFIMQKITNSEDTTFLHPRTIKNFPSDKTMTLRLRGKNGEEYWTEHHLIRFYNSDDKLAAIEGIARDVTIRIIAEEERRKSEANYHALAENFPNGGVFLFNHDMMIEVADGTLFNRLGFKKSELEGHSIPELILAIGVPLENRNVFAAALRGKETKFNFKYQEIYLSVHILPVKNQAKSILFGMGVVIDITEQVKSEKIIQKQLHRLASLNSIDKAITGVLEPEEVLSLIIQQTCEQLGADAADVLILESETHKLKYAAGQGFKSEAVARVVLDYGQGEASRAIIENRTIEMHRIQKENQPTGFSQVLAEEGFGSYFAVALVAKDVVKGVLEVYRYQPYVPDPEWLKFLETIAQQAAIALDNADLFSSMQQSNQDLTHAYNATIEGWSRALDLRDKETEGHTERVTVLTLQLAKTMGIPESEMVNVWRGALLHDIGKMGIPDNILLKPGPLTDEEWVIMRKHPQYAYDLIAPIEYLKSSIEIPLYHHERWDGTGYPFGLKGTDIPLSARIFAVIDIWDALCSDRVYRPAWPKEKALAYIQEQSGKQLDPEVVRIFIDAIFSTLPETGSAVQS